MTGRDIANTKHENNIHVYCSTYWSLHGCMCRTACTRYMGPFMDECVELQAGCDEQSLRDTTVSRKLFAKQVYGSHASVENEGPEWPQ